MKIKISENETIEIKNIYEEFTLTDLTDLVERLNNAFPSSKITTFSGNTLPYKSPFPRIKKAKVGNISREQAIEILKDYYLNHNNSKTDKKRISKLRKSFKILPQEVGLIKFPTGRWKLSQIINPNQINSNQDNSNKKQIKYHRKNKKNRFSRLNPNPLYDTREKAIRLLKLSYFGTRDEKYKLASDNNQIWDDIVKALHGLKKRYNILPQDIGLNNFPTRFDRASIKFSPQTKKENKNDKKDELLEEVQYY